MRAKEIFKNIFTNKRKKRNLFVGAIFYALDTKRFLLQQRSSRVREPFTWGSWGGRVEWGEEIIAGLKRETREEGGFIILGSWRLIPVGVNNKYHNYVVVVPKEKDINVTTNIEVKDYGWFDLQKFPKRLHFGVRFVLNNRLFKDFIHSNI